MATTPPFRFPNNFFENDCHLLNDLEKSALVNFFRKLQNNPYSPSLAEQKEGFYASEFSPRRVVYWKLVETKGKLECIKVLRIQYL